MKTVTLQDLGCKLPIGMVKGKQLLKKFELRPFKTKIDRHLAAWIRSNASRSDEITLEAKKVAKLISLICSHVEGEALPVTERGDSPPESEAKIYNWWYADVMYAYMQARVQALGSIMTIPIACPNCRYSTDAARFDLNSTEVLIVEDINELYKWVDLKHPFLLRDGRTKLTSVKIGPTKWSTFCQPGVLDTEINTFDVTSMRDAICAINHDDSKPYTLVNVEIDELHKLDFERIERMSEDVTAGPDIRTTVECPSCSFPIVNPLQWTYDFFFGSSFHVVTDT